MLFPASLTRRRLLGGALRLGLLCAAPSLLAAPRELTVLTSYPEALMSHFEDAFERAHPDIRLNLLWRAPNDALGYLSQPDQGGVDVYWAASPRTFESLRQAGAWRPIGIDRTGLPERIGTTRLSAPDGSYLATELAGYGFALDRRALAELGVAPPADWSDLADPRLAGRIALPVPSEVGFAPVMVDIVLQAYGWERGWALWNEIAGLSYLVHRGSTFVSDEVTGQRAAVGLSIDFFVTGAIAGGAPLEFAYPRHGGLNPAHVAITAGSKQVEAAQTFVAFLLSESGQRLLAHPDIHRLPVRESVYPQLPAGYHDPFRAAAAGGYDYDNDLGRARLGVVSALFEQMLIRQHEEQRALWTAIHQREARDGQRLTAIREQLCQPLIGEKEAGDPQLQASFRRVEGDRTAANEIEARWGEQAQQRRRQVRQQLESLG
ncbi:ABC transporter substrate-binding protein [Azotobacter vinelandii]|uniref:ABC transporter substrate-binding protein n=1 Tax=Azotobacter vinelandii TaxID=354 RepID=UPI0009EB2BD0|nr:extracellular solute-binding protein [Azotobacter vinelandii]WKN22020.1 extracellular solute-binding protein [Azotobacter vinelandii]